MTPRSSGSGLHHGASRRLGYIDMDECSLEYLVSQSDSNRGNAPIKRVPESTVKSKT